MYDSSSSCLENIKANAKPVFREDAIKMAVIKYGIILKVVPNKKPLTMSTLLKNDPATGKIYIPDWM